MVLLVTSRFLKGQKLQKYAIFYANFRMFRQMIEVEIEKTKANVNLYAIRLQFVKGRFALFLINSVRKIKKLLKSVIRKKYFYLPNVMKSIHDHRPRICRDCLSRLLAATARPVLRSKYGIKNFGISMILKKFIS